MLLQFLKLTVEVLLDSHRQRKLKCLLLVCVLIGNITADCPVPEAFQNTVPTTETLLMNDFPVGSEVTVECGNGYVKESGSEIIRCVDDKWTTPELICKKKDCGPPDPQPNMHFDTSEGTLFGAKVKVSCDEGYALSGSGYRQCYDSGWLLSTSCDIVTCDKPAEVTNGRNSWSSDDHPEHGQLITYSCDEGYAISGSDSIECLKTGVYNSQPPECIGVTTEDTFTAILVTSAPSSPQPETSTSAVSSSTSAAHRDTTITASASPTVSASERGARYLMTTEERPATTITSVLWSPFGERHTETLNPNKDNVVLLSAISTTVVVLGFFVIGLILFRFHQRKKGSYDTREDLKPELLQFQNL